jgi:hypothetical protein
MPNTYSITFETKCYENDWEFLLKTNYLDNMISNCNINFTYKHLIINNVKHPAIVEKYAKKKVNKGIIDRYYFVDDYAESVLSFFNLSKEMLGKGYYYSIAELTGIFLCSTEYLLHFSSDSFLLYKDKYNWIEKACHYMKAREDFFVANPTWYFDFESVKTNANNEHIGDFYIGNGFSDQCYLIKTSDFKKRIYNHYNTVSERYPKYGGELFEKRVDSYMQNSFLKRITFIKSSYIHYNFPRNPLYKNIILFLLNNFFAYYYLRRLFRKIYNIILYLKKHYL